MDQDSDKDRAGGQRPRRDGEQRSFGRRDDAPRGDAPRGDNRRAGGSRFGKDTDGDSRRNSGPRTNDRPDSRSDRPNRFDRTDSADRRSDGPRRDDAARGDAKPRFSANRENRDDRRSNGPRSESRPRIDSPRFSSRPDSRSSDRPDRREDGRREDGPREYGRRGDDSRGSGPRRDGPSRPGRFSKPGPTRVGGFQPEADERNRAERSRNEDRPRTDDQSRNRPDRRSSSRDDAESRRGDGASRYSAEQRKDSGERRTGRYEKAPNYNLDQRAHEQRDRNDRSDSRRDDRSRSDSRRDDKPARSDNDRRDSRRADERSSRPAGPRERYPDPQKPDNQAPAKRPADDGTTRLNRFIANSGVCSRREADELIANGDISVNGNVVTEMGFRVKEGDMVKYGTKALTPERFVYVLLNKPKDYITTTDDPEERRTVMELVADAGNFRMYPVGRLDRKTTGLLLITNDGELADKLTHPSNNVRKIYQVEIDKPITEEDFETLKRGMELEDGPIKPDAVGIVTPDAQVIGLEIHSGRNRIVRRMFEQLGYDVLKLDRTSFVGLTKKELPRGKWRYLDPKEVIKLKYLN